MKKELEMVHEWLMEELPEHSGNGSGIPDGYVWNSPYAQFFKDTERNQVIIYPVIGGGIYLNSDGTWDADGSPFSD